MKRTYSHIDMDERRKIARWRTAGLTVDIIAEKLGRHRSTIFREIRRNMFIDDAVSNLNGYYCVTAHDMRLRTADQTAQADALLACPAICHRPDHARLVATADRWPDAP